MSKLTENNIWEIR